MDYATTIYFRLLRWQNVYRRNKRLVFPSPAEMRLVELMGGRVLRLKFLRDRRTHFPLALVIRQPKLFKRERVRREVGYGSYWVDFANDLNRIIEVDGSAYHMDVVADFDREVAIKEICRRHKYDARFLRIRGDELYRDPNVVQRKVLEFLAG
jgi:very-short-patch-repair endonuclease